MKILMVNKFFYIKGGSETYYFSLKKLLEKKGHQIIDFSMQDEKNLESKYSDFFIDSVDYNSKQSIVSKIKAGIKIIYSFEAKQKLEKLIKETKPDIAHLHIFQHQLSLSILDVLKKYNIPIVYTAHDLKMICPNYKMLTNNMVCQQCKDAKYINCMKNKCIKDSTIKSGIAMLEAYINKIRKSYEKIDYIITPSEFYKSKFIEFGIKENRISHISNFLGVEDIEYDKLENQNYFLYFGRLSEEKGINTLIKAMKGINMPLKIVGTGPMEEQVNNYVKEKELANIEVLGFKSGVELYTLVGNAKAVILPSEWYENGPYSAIESLKLGRILIGSDLGGIPELIDEGENGFIFTNRKESELNEKLRLIEEMKQKEMEKMQEKSVAKFKKMYTEENYYNKLISAYKMILKK
jgi:Glycosyltransferase